MPRAAGSHRAIDRRSSSRTQQCAATLVAQVGDGQACLELVEGAIVYGTKRWTALTRFLDDGRLEIDNSEPVAAIGPRPLARAERSLRGIAVGRRNWLFAGSRVGGERAAAICTVIETCKMNGVDPQAYIADVIAKIAADWPAVRWDELMPWNWQPQSGPVRMAA